MSKHFFNFVVFKMYASIIPNTTYEKNGYCVTANYVVNSDNTVGVTNSQNIGGPRGANETAFGTLYPTPIHPGIPVEPGKFTLRIKRAHMIGFYWVIALGNINSDGKYDWASK
jgi:hypothetical protein